jgi:tetratricopeptide (TPR) repeat protein
MPTISEIFDLAVGHHQSGHLQQAEELYRRVLQAEPQHVNAWHLLGLLAEQFGRPDLACEYLGRALQLDPTYAVAHNSLGAVLQGLGRLEEAEASYREALRLKPDFSEAHYNLGKVLKGQDKLDEAATCYRRALLCKPDNAEAHNNLGNILQFQEKLDEAAACYLSALRLRPEYVVAHFNLGNVLTAQDKLEEASACQQRAIRLKPDFYQAHNNLGNIRKAQGQWDQAKGCYREVLRLNPEYEEAHFNLGMLSLELGNFEEGWAEYEWRHKVKNFLPRSFPQPRWDGSALVGKTILLQAEQGLGDTFQFVRYVQLVKQCGGRVLLECQPPLVEIMKSCPGIDHILTSNDPVPAFDVQAPLLSLPSIMKTTLATVPAPIPYLSAQPALTEYWRQELSQISGFRIGIVWQGDAKVGLPWDGRAEGRRRSIPLACFEPLARLPGVRLFSLQKGHGSEQLAQRQVRLGIIDLGEKLDKGAPFLDTAAVMMNLDLIISSDTSPVHLAGALGRPVWAALPFSGCWRWLHDREDSPWYPSMRLFRQKTPGDWGEVFQRIAGEIEKR